MSTDPSTRSGAAPKGAGGEGGGARRPRRVRGTEKKSVARLAAVQALYQMDVTGRPADDVAKEFELYRLAQEIDGERLKEADVGWFRAVLAGVVESQRTIDRSIDATLAEGWPLRRIDLTLRAVLRAGVYELAQQRAVPARVAINEYVEVAKAFFSDDEPKIANAVLDRIARQLRPEEFGAPRPDPGPAAGPGDAGRGGSEPGAREADVREPGGEGAAADEGSGRGAVTPDTGAGETAAPGSGGRDGTAGDPPATDPASDGPGGRPGRFDETEPGEAGPGRVD